MAGRRLQRGVFSRRLRYTKYLFKNNYKLMKKEEIRIGNLVQKNGGNLILTEELFHEWLHADAEEGYFKPMLLSSQLLEEFGFKEFGLGPDDEDPVGDLNIHYKILCTKEHDFILAKELDKTFTVTTPEIYKNIKYANELQNLYFALSGNELKLSK
jgi:hypothetical protein